MRFSIILLITYVLIVVSVIGRYLQQVMQNGRMIQYYGCYTHSQCDWHSHACHSKTAECQNSECICITPKSSVNLNKNDVIATYSSNNNQKQDSKKKLNNRQTTQRPEETLEVNSITKLLNEIQQLNTKITEMQHNFETIKLTSNSLLNQVSNLQSTLQKETAKPKQPLPDGEHKISVDIEYVTPVMAISNKFGDVNSALPATISESISVVPISTLSTSATIFHSSVIDTYDTDSLVIEPAPFISTVNDPVSPTSLNVSSIDTAASSNPLPFSSSSQSTILSSVNTDKLDSLMMDDINSSSTSSLNFTNRLGYSDSVLSTTVNESVTAVPMSNSSSSSITFESSVTVTNTDEPNSFTSIIKDNTSFTSLNMSTTATSTSSTVLSLSNTSQSMILAVTNESDSLFMNPAPFNPTVIDPVSSALPLNMSMTDKSSLYRPLPLSTISYNTTMTITNVEEPDYLIIDPAPFTSPTVNPVSSTSLNKTTIDTSTSSTPIPSSSTSHLNTEEFDYLHIDSAPFISPTSLKPLTTPLNKFGTLISSTTPPLSNTSQPTTRIVTNMKEPGYLTFAPPPAAIIDSKSSTPLNKSVTVSTSSTSLTLSSTSRRTTRIVTNKDEREYLIIDPAPFTSSISNNTSTTPLNKSVTVSTSSTSLPLSSTSRPTTRMVTNKDERDYLIIDPAPFTFSISNNTSSTPLNKSVTVSTSSTSLPLSSTSRPTTRIVTERDYIIIDPAPFTSSISNNTSSMSLNKSVTVSTSSNPFPLSSSSQSSTPIVTNTDKPDYLIIDPAPFTLSTASTPLNKPVTAISTSTTSLALSSTSQLSPMIETNTEKPDYLIIDSTPLKSSTTVNPTSPLPTPLDKSSYNTIFNYNHIINYFSINVSEKQR